jgi:phage terminase Nu1 subunit (DNA packaging protein)
MATSENPHIVSLTAPQAAALAGISYARLNQLLTEDDPPPREPDKTYRTDKMGEWIGRRAVSKALGHRKNAPVLPGGDGPTDLLNPVQERARKDKELADKAALENQVRRGELVEAAVVGVKWKEIMLRVRSRMMRIAWASAPLLVGEEDQVKIQIAIEDQIRDALTELAAS